MHPFLTPSTYTLKPTTMFVSIKTFDFLAILAALKGPVLVPAAAEVNLASFSPSQIPRDRWEIQGSAGEARLSLTQNVNI